MTAEPTKAFRWLRTGDEVFQAMLRAIGEAKASIRLEMYIYTDSPVGREFRAALIEALKRDVRVMVLLDAVGSQSLNDEFWKPFLEAGGEFRWFNPVSLGRFGFRDHRKVVVCDAQFAIVGGFNIAAEYQGDGIMVGWRDLALTLEGDLARELAVSFDFMFDLASFRHFRFMRLRKTAAKQQASTADGQLLLSGPGRGQSPLKSALCEDLRHGKDIQIIAAYFVPVWSVWHELINAARRGAKVSLMVPFNSDVPVSKLATQSLYRRLLRAGVRIYEFLPQMLHTKLVIIDDTVYGGSANIDVRSFYINYELMVRVRNPRLASEARALFQNDMQYCQQIELAAWRKSRTFWTRLKQRWAFFLLARIDPYIARRQLKTLRS